jgi:hypothetical protein
MFNLLADDLISVQPMSGPTSQNFFIDSVCNSAQTLEEKRNPHFKGNYAQDGTFWNINWNNDVFEVQVTETLVEIVRVWRHQLKKWRLPEASDYMELKLNLKKSFDQLKQEEKDRKNCRVGEFTSFMLPIIKKTYPELSYVYNPYIPITC